MRSAELAIVALTLFAVSPLAAQDDVVEAQPKKSGTQRYRLPQIALVGYVTNVERDGTLLLLHIGQSGEVGITEGHYLALALKDIESDPSVLLRVKLAAVLPEGRVRLKVAPEAVERIEDLHVIGLMRPVGSTTRQIKAAPAVAPIVNTYHENAIAGMPGAQAAKLAHSKNNLRMIALALHLFHDVHNRLPPAVIYGPDGKPWHSWRVLILPFLVEEGEALYNRYRFDEPWDGPNNSKLLKEMPDVFRDPVYGDTADQYYTHYAGAVGRSSAFAPGGKFNGQPDGLAAGIGPGNSFGQFIDGMSNTVMVGSVSPERKIPWMKPEDISVGETIPGIGTKDGFAAPYEAEAGKAGVFMRADGSVRTIRTDVDKETFRRLLLFNDRQVVDYDEVATIDPPIAQSDGRSVPVIEIQEGKDGVVARMTSEFVPRTRRSVPGAKPPGSGGAPDGDAASERKSESPDVPDER